MAPPDLVRVGELLLRVLADRLQHQETVVVDRLDEAVVDQGGNAVEVGGANVLRRIEGERAHEDREAGEELLRAGVE